MTERDQSTEALRALGEALEFRGNRIEGSFTITVLPPGADRETVIAHLHNPKKRLH